MERFGWEDRSWMWLKIGVKGQRAVYWEEMVWQPAAVRARMPGVPNDWHSYEFAEIVDQSSISLVETRSYLGRY